MISDSRCPSVISTLSWILEEGFSSSANASAAAMCLCIRVVARLQGAAVAAVLRRVGEGAHARDHALVQQLLAHLGGGFAGLDLDRDAARARARVVRRVQVVVPDVVEAAAGDGEHDHQDGEGDPRRGAAHGALALLGFPPRGRLGGGAPRPLRSRGAHGRRARGAAGPRARRKSSPSLNPGRRPLVVLVIPPGLVLVHVAVPAPAVTIPMIIGVIPGRRSYGRRGAARAGHGRAGSHPAGW